MSNTVSAGWLAELMVNSFVLLYLTTTTMTTLAAMLIQKDPRNNSAWNERWFAVHKCLKQPPLSLDKCRAEADYAIFQGAALDPYNESPFRYLIGLLQEQQQQAQSDTSSTATPPKVLAAEFYAKVQSLEKVLVDANRDPEACTNWTSARIDLLESMGDAASLTQGIALAQGLANQYDTIRKKYWELRIRQFQQQLSAAS
jgi:protein farnesyltransferase/geranylgeranyltransferase type-1 subunit alpha